MLLAVVIFLLVVGSIAFHFATPGLGLWFPDIAADWSTIDLTIDVTFWVTGAVFVLVNLFMAYCVYRFRHKPGHKAVYEPENTRLEKWLTIVTAVGVAVMLAPGLVVWAQFVQVPDEADEYEVLAQQWQWQFRYPGEDGVLGVADVAFVSESNPFGINPEDPNGQDDVVVDDPEMHLPVDRPVKALLRSHDVLHNYTVPQFRVKMDLVPGLVSYLWFTPNKVGTYDILCEELCGIGHFIMRGRVVVETAAEFATWLDAQPTFAETQAQVAGNPTAGQALYAVCATCHGAQGEGVQALGGPKLTGLQPWYMERQLQYFKDGVRGANEGDVFGRTMAPMTVGLVDEQAIRDVTAYIGTLPDVPAPVTIDQDSVDTANGKDIYDRNCAACHLDDASGTWYTDAPRLASMSDWYFVTQINNFRQGIRGLHREDDYGEQMVQMATAMSEDEVADVAAYLNTLRPSANTAQGARTDTAQHIAQRVAEATSDAMRDAADAAHSHQDAHSHAHPAGTHD